MHYQYDPVQTTKTSVHGAINMLGLAKRVKAQDPAGLDLRGLRRSEVHPQTEDYWGNVNPIGPRSCYDEGKRCAETLFFDYHRQHKLESRSRASSTPTARACIPNDGRVVSNFIVQALQGRPITIYGDGAQTRSFCYVDDLIDGLVSLMETADDFTGPVNLGNPAEATILELAQKIIALTGSSSSIVLRSLPENDPKRRQPDRLSLARERLSYWPRVSWDEGLAKTVAYFRQVLRDEHASRAVPAIALQDIAAA